jgi:predicted ferric reductase
MRRYVEGTAWFLLYGGLVSLPLALGAWFDPVDAPRPVARELSAAFGLLAYSLTLAQFALVSRLSAASRPFGSDALLQFHQYAGVLCLLFAAGHAVLLGGPGRWSAWSGATLGSGFVAIAALLLLFVTTVTRRRLRLTYEWWRSAHVTLALVVTASLLFHVLQSGRYSQLSIVRTTLAVYAALAVLVLAHYRLVRPWQMTVRPWEVVRNDDVGGRVRLLQVRPVGHSGFRFEPGQFAWLITGSSPWSAQQHPLSIASSSTTSAKNAPDGSLEFAIKAAGDWSGEIVPRLSPGARVWVDGPYGAFTVDRKAAQGFVLIAGGIGIAPFRSMLLTLRDRGDRRPVVLVYAAGSAPKLAFRDELESMVRQMNLEVVFVLEQPDPGWTGERGTITEELLRRHLPADLGRFVFLVCGPVGMMDAVWSMLRRIGVPPRMIDTERFTVV